MHCPRVRHTGGVVFKVVRGCQGLVSARNPRNTPAVNRYPRGSCTPYYLNLNLKLASKGMDLPSILEIYSFSLSRM